MSGFRKFKTILREGQGSYINGTWSPGVRSTVSILASCQPIISGHDLQSLPEGRHLSDFAKFYTDNRLQVTADGEGIQPDIFVHENYCYEITSIFANQSDVINHFKYIGVKIFKFTSIEDWITGTLERP